MRRLTAITLAIAIAILPFGVPGTALADDPLCYHIIIAAGQSNNYSGTGSGVPDTGAGGLDAATSSIWQVDRFGNDGHIIQASEPIQHIYPLTDRVGYVLAFAKKYKFDGRNGSCDILIVPTGLGDSGFVNNKWNEGDQQYVDTVNRAAIAMAATSTLGNEIVAFLWMQGEADAGRGASGSYATSVQAFSQSIREDIGATNTPFIVGGLMPVTVAAESEYAAVDAILADIGSYATNSAYADPNVPFELTNNSGDTDVHYSAESQRGSSTQDFAATSTLGLAGRFYTAYVELYNEINPEIVYNRPVVPANVRLGGLEISL